MPRVKVIVNVVSNIRAPFPKHVSTTIIKRVVPQITPYFRTVCVLLTEVVGRKHGLRLQPKGELDITPFHRRKDPSLRGRALSYNHYVDAGCYKDSEDVFGYGYTGWGLLPSGEYSFLMLHKKFTRLENDNIFLMKLNLEQTLLKGNIEMQTTNPAFVTTYQQVIAMRAMTGVLRVNEHHFANRLSTQFTDFNFLQKNFGDSEFTQLVQLLHGLGYIVETRNSGGKGMDRALNAFFIAPKTTGETEELLLAAIHISVTETNIRYASYVAYGYDVKESEVIAFVKRYESEAPVTLTYVTGFDQQGNAIKSTKVIDLTYNVPRDIFYPYIKEGMEGVSNQFLGADTNLLLLVGPPGTGKSSLQRQLCRDYRDRPIFQMCGDKVILNPHFDNFLVSLPDDALVLIEDADAIIGKRKEGNTTMSLLLNELDGIARNNKKFVISTNLDNLKMVDEGLLRPGRCFAVKQFRFLTIDEARVIVTEMGLPEEHIANNVSLAEVLDGKNDAAKASGVGFL